MNWLDKNVISFYDEANQALADVRNNINRIIDKRVDQHYVYTDMEHFKSKADFLSGMLMKEHWERIVQ